MRLDLTGFIGVLMRVADGAELSVAEVERLRFDCPDDLTPLLNAAFIKLLEFAHDADLRSRDRALDLAMREALGAELEEIARSCELPPTRLAAAWSSIHRAA